VCALGQRLHHFVDHVTTTLGAANGPRVRHWFQEKAGWYAVLTDPQMPVTSMLLDQALNTIEWQLFAMQGCHYAGGSQQAFLTGQASEYPHQTGGSTCKSSPRVAFDEQKKRSTTSCGGMCFFPFLFSFFIPPCNHPFIVAASSS
jgi:hypothetical protein